MNGKQAKRLRKQAQQATNGHPLISYAHKGTPPRYVTTPDFRTVKVAPGTPQVLSSLCTRKVYKQMKSSYKLANHT